MNDTDLWNELEVCIDDKDKKLQKIGEQLLELYKIAYCWNWDNSNPTLNKIVEYNTWNIYDDIWNGITFKESVTKYKEKK